jgi:hypothetical protein
VAASLCNEPGGVAQLVERYVRNVEVDGSSPFTSTRFCDLGRRLARWNRIRADPTTAHRAPG